MASHKPTGLDDEPPPSSTQRRDQRALREIYAILRTRFEIPVQSLQLHSRFVEDLGIDIFDLPDLILALEEAFELDIPVGLAARILTVKDAVECVLLERNSVSGDPSTIR